MSGECAAVGEKAKECPGAKGNIKDSCCGDLVCSGQKCVEAGGGGGGSADCPTSLFPTCFGWVRGKSGKLHVLVEIGGLFSDGIKPVNGANVEYETRVNDEFNTAVSTTMGDYVFRGYQEDYKAACGDFDGVTGNANCFETAPEDSPCSVKVTSITLSGCSGELFDATDDNNNTDTCTFAGRNAPRPCQVMN